MDPKVQQQLLDEVNKVGRTLANHAPAAWQTILDVTRINCISYLIYGAISFVTLILFTCIFGKRLWNYAKDNEYRTQGFSWLAFTFGFGFPAFGLCIYSCALLNVWNWVGVFYPQLFLIQQAIDKITSNNGS